MQASRVLGQSNAREHTHLLENSSWQAAGHVRYRMIDLGTVTMHLEMSISC